MVICFFKNEDDLNKVVKERLEQVYSVWKDTKTERKEIDCGVENETNNAMAKIKAQSTVQK